MVGLHDSIKLVKENLANNDYAKTTTHEQSTVDHDKILRDYDDMMREHQQRMESHERHTKRRDQDQSSMRFRFKSKDKTGSSSSSKKRHTSRGEYRKRNDDYDGNHDRQHHGRRRTRSPSVLRDDTAKIKTADADVSAYAAHPFARPKTSAYLDPTVFPSASLAPADNVSSPPPQPPPTDKPFEGPDDAFRSSLFDAIADDEGAAYWEGVYGEPIHVYGRPAVETAPGVLEQMNDDQYAEFVKKKMWEKKNPELVREREERARRDAEDQRERKKRSRRDRDDSAESDYEWVGNEEKGYERRRVRGKHHPKPPFGGRSSARRGFMSDVDEALARGAKRKEAKEWQQAWATYHKKWVDLTESKVVLHGQDLADAIPWPTKSGEWESVSREEIEDFFRNFTLGEAETMISLLKAERFRWHPDKIQHRFGGENVDADTLKLVTSVFQTIDEMVARERTREAKH